MDRGRLARVPAENCDLGVSKGGDVEFLNGEDGTFYRNNRYDQSWSLVWKRMVLLMINAVIKSDEKSRHRNQGRGSWEESMMSCARRWCHLIRRT